MSSIKPELIQIVSIKMFQCNVHASNDFLNNPIDIDGIAVEVGQNTAHDFDKKLFRIRLVVKIEGMKDKDNKAGLSGEYGIEFHVLVENLDDFITENNGEKLVDRKLGGTLMGLVYSTARGILYEKTSNTFFNGVLLPVIDPNTLLN